MKYLCIDKKSISHFITISVCFSAGILLVVFSDEIKEEIISAVHSCVNVIIPCVFPMLFISCFLTEYGFSDGLKRKAEKITKRLFGLSGACLEAMVTGLTTGYVSAVKGAEILYKNNKISSAEAKRLALFFSNPGISFTVIFFGGMLCNSVFYGIKLYFISASVNVLSAAVYNLINKNTSFCRYEKKKNSALSSFTKACEISSASIIRICFSIIIFSAIQVILTRLADATPLSVLIKLAGEVSSAIIYSTENYSVVVSFFVLQYGGFCILLQVTEGLKNIEIKPSAYLIIRLILSFTSSAFLYVLSPVFPLPVICITDKTVISFSTNSLTGIFSLLLLCFVYLYSVRGIRRNFSKRQ